MASSFSNIADSLRRVVTEVEARKGDIAFVATQNTEADLKLRIFNKGLDENEREIGKYSTKPIYVSIAKTKEEYGGEIPSGNLRPKGKAGRGNFKNGKTRKSQYFPGGYREFRDTVNRNSSRVDLTLSRRLQNAINTVRKGKETVIRFTDKDELEKASHLSDKYNKEIFAVNSKEAEALGRFWSREIGIILNKHLG